MKRPILDRLRDLEERAGKPPPISESREDEDGWEIAQRHWAQQAALGWKMRQAVEALRQRSFDYHVYVGATTGKIGVGTSLPHFHYGWEKCPDEPCVGDRAFLADIKALLDTMEVS